VLDLDAIALSTFNGLEAQDDRVGQGSGAMRRIETGDPFPADAWAAGAGSGVVFLADGLEKREPRKWWKRPHVTRTSGEILDSQSYTRAAAQLPAPAGGEGEGGAGARADCEDRFGEEGIQQTGGAGRLPRIGAEDFAGQFVEDRHRCRGGCGRSSVQREQKKQEDSDGEGTSHAG